MKLASKCSSVLLFFLLTLAGAASAQIPTKGNIFVGYSYVSADTNSAGRANLNGWNGSLEGKVFPFVGLVTDISGHYGTRRFPNLVCAAVPGQSCPPAFDAKTYNVLFGPRVSVAVGKFTPFAHALVGVSHISANAGGTSDTSFASALGGGLDYNLLPAFAWRVQADMLQTRFFGNTQNNFRLSTGIVFHF